LITSSFRAVVVVVVKDVVINGAVVVENIYAVVLIILTKCAEESGLHHYLLFFPYMPMYMANKLESHITIGCAVHAVVSLVTGVIVVVVLK
jgi:hypothetical protein